jgi:TPR repeat protein
LFVSGFFAGSALRGQDLPSPVIRRPAIAEAGQTNEPGSPNEWYAAAKKFLAAKDYNHALIWMRKAAEAGQLFALNDLGDLYYSGEGVPQDYQQAFVWYSKGALAGNIFAMANLAYLYEHGWGVNKDAGQACAWYQKAGAAGDQDSIRNLKVLDPTSEPVVQDPVRTREWYQKAAEAGNGTAMYKLGQLYEDGQRVIRDYRQAAEWYRQAAENGVSEAMNDLGVLYTKGQGVPQDQVKAREWYQKAAAAGNPEALKNLQMLSSIGTFIQTADRLSRTVFWFFLLPAAIIFIVATGRYAGLFPSRFNGPSRVKLALLLLWINLTVALARLTFASIRDQVPGFGVACFLGIIALGLHALLLRYVGKGSNPARIILLLIILLALPLSPILAQIESLLSAIFMIVGLALSGYAACLLFSGESGHWFKGRGRDRIVLDGQPQPGAL